MRIVLFVCAVSAAFVACAAAATAASTTFVTGTVTDHGKPATGIPVSIAGNNIVQKTKTDDLGRFSFAALTVGTYTVTAIAAGGTASETINLASGGATLALEVGARTLGSVTVAATRLTRGSGGDLVLNQDSLAKSSAGTSLPQVLIQFPGAARGANGVVHMNGDHGDINYVVDGVSIPQELNRSIGAEFDLNDVSYIEVLEGAYPAQYGERFGGVLNISTRAAAGPPGTDASLAFGSYAHVDTALGVHGPLGRGSFVFSTRNERGDRGLDPPNFDSPHNAFSNANQFARLTVPAGHGNDYWNATVSHAFRTYQIPNDVASGEPATTDDSEWQDDTFATVQFHHAIGDRGALSFGPSVKRSRIRDFGDPGNDFTFGENLNLNNGGGPTDCANAVSSGIFGPTTCGFSLFSDKTASDYKFNADYALRSAAHEVRAGAFYDTTLVAKDYEVTLQPGNFLAPIFMPSDPGAAFTVVDNAPNVGHTEAGYLQDNWRWNDRNELDCGLRVDAFQLSSTQFHTAASMFSPRLKFTRFFGPRASAYVYYGRFFTPFSFENVSPQAAQLLNLPLQASPAQFDLKPERDSMYEIGAHVPLGRGDLGLRVWQKNATDLIDDTQVGVTALHQDINFNLGRLAMQILNYQQPLAHDGRFYVTFAREISLNKGCETQLLAPCFGSSTDWTPADHEQRWESTGGVLRNDMRGGWFAVDYEYGSGLSSASCPPGTPGFCKRTPHTTFDFEKGFRVGPNTFVTASIHNVLNDRYYVTLLNAQGNHFAPPRTFDLGVRFGQ